MSNDVHLAKVSKIHKSIDTAPNKSKGSIRCRNDFRLNGKGGDVMDDIRPSIDDEYLFGSISPRGGGCINPMAQLFPGDLESPDHTHRDTTTESDNNISSCSTLDIVNKVSCFINKRTHVAAIFVWLPLLRGLLGSGRLGAAHFFAQLRNETHNYNKNVPTVGASKLEREDAIQTTANVFWHNRIIFDI